jgi:hypothetical protein
MTLLRIIVKRGWCNLNCGLIAVRNLDVPIQIVVGYLFLKPGSAPFQCGQWTLKTGDRVLVFTNHKFDFLHLASA